MTEPEVTAWIRDRCCDRLIDRYDVPVSLAVYLTSGSTAFVGRAERHGLYVMLSDELGIEDGAEAVAFG